MLRYLWLSSISRNDIGFLTAGMSVKRNFDFGANEKNAIYCNQRVRRKSLSS
jgi:hypothetical protein